MPVAVSASNTRPDVRERTFRRLIDTLFCVMWTLASAVILEFWYFDRRVYMRTVPWLDILEMAARGSGLRLTVPDPLKYKRSFEVIMRTVPPLRPWFSTGSATILFSGLNATRRAIAAAVKAHRPMTAKAPS